MGQRLRKRVIALFLVALGVTVALALGEAALRAVGVSFPSFYMPGFGHWNHAGHELAGKLARHLCACAGR